MAIARIVSQINQRRFWEIPRPRLGWFEKSPRKHRFSGGYTAHNESLLRYGDWRCDETTRALAVFQDDCRFPQAVGAIDGTHIEIIAPEEPFDYFDRHHRYSVILQAVVGQNLTFLDTAIGYLGSMHDARVLRSSDIFQKAQDGEILTEPLARINGVQVRPLLLGDGAYPLLPWLMKPYPNGANLNRSQRRFNKTLSSARSTVERAFGVLKARWRILLKRLDNRFENIPDVILSCCILHNFCQKAGEEFDDEEILRRIIRVDREYLETRRQENIVHNPTAERIRLLIEQSLT
ncbi:protein ANTAGONIST OF LIKE HETEROCHROMATIN PROTEIN 1-like [Dendronephthya gigantea]|uniref:protein ANTAGONIST OF LIKE HETEROCHROMATIN PROTEIN 1-like n=1 Tax=Dendronephthya gigantea TaxID=151771 RepID=UPI00106D8AD7|nr:protein ANTAGONIST OF LIKE HETEROCHROMATIN PROTEIN 1-like [Dendronephthya gigantea]